MSNLKHPKIITIFILLLLVVGILSQASYLDKHKNIYVDSAIDVENAMYEDIENFARQNARYLAKGIGMCINDKLDGVTELTPEVLSIIKNCGDEFKSGGPTGDFYVFNRLSKRMVYDGSPDCMKGGEFRFFDYRQEVNWIANGEQVGECWMHQKPELCVQTIKNLYNIGNTNELSGLYWQFDNDDERLESYVIPDLYNGYSGPLGIKGVSNMTHNNIQLQIVVGTQKDEVMANFRNIKEVYYKNKKHGLAYINGIWENYVIMVILLCLMATVTTLAIKINLWKS